MAKRLAERWQAIFWRGAITILFAISAFAWPVVTISAILVLFGVFALIDGALAFLVAMREAPRTRWSVAMLAEGMFGAFAGVAALLFAEIAVPIVAAWAIVTGALEIAAASALGGPGHVRIPLAVGGGISVAAGALIALFPNGAVAWVLGAYALSVGTVLLIVAFRVRSASWLPGARSPR